MKKQLKNGLVIGYSIGENIEIHPNINDPESWFVTIRPLQIFGKRICKKTCSESEIARHINVLLHIRLNDINSLISDVIPLT